MRILVDVSHPAHVHLFRNAIRVWQERGDATLITAREKEVITGLLSRYGLEFEVLTRERTGWLGLGRELLERDWRLWRRARRFRPDFLIGTSPSAAHVSRLVRGQSVFFCEDDRPAVPLQWAISHPFAHWICTPESIKETYGRKHIKHNSYHELAYLHPSRFTPDPGIRARLGVRDGERYFIMRFVGLHAHHDAGERGLSHDTKVRLLERLGSEGRVFITSEAPLAAPFEDHRMSLPADALLDMLAFADLVVSDSQTVTAEAAVLGTPNVRCNTFVGRLSYLDELEERYGLTRGFLPQDSGALLATVDEWLAEGDARARFAEGRARMLEDKCDLTAWIVSLLDALARGEPPRPRTAQAAGARR